MQAEDHLQGRTASDLVTEVPEGFRQTAALEDRRVEIVAQTVHVLGELRHLRRDGVELDPLRISAGKLSAHHFELKGQGGEPLADVVVQLLGDAPPCVLLGGHQAPDDPAKLGAARLQGRPAAGQLVLRPLQTAGVEGFLHITASVSCAA